MTRKEIIGGLQFTIDMFEIDPSTGEKAWLNEEDRLTVDACKGAIQILKQEPCEGGLNVDNNTNNRDARKLC